MVRERQFYKTLFAIAIPAALQSIVSLLVGTVDTVMVGQLGDEALAGIAVSNQVNTFLFALLTGVAGGSSALIAQYWGKRDTETIKHIFSVILILCTGIGALATAAALVFPRVVLRLMAGENDEMIAAALPYFTAVCFSYVLFAATTALASMLRNVEVAMAALVTSIAANVVNIFFNWVLIFGRLGFPQMGGRGAAVATVISRAVEFFVIAVYALRVQKKFPLKPMDLLRPRFYLLKDYCVHGLPIAMSDSLWAFVNVFKAAIIGHLGTVMTSANAIAESIMSMGNIGSGSLAAGACVVIGKAVGEGDRQKVRTYSNTIQILFAVMAVIMASAVFFLRAPIAGLFDVSEGVRSLAVSMIAIGAFTLLGTLYHAACFQGINRGAGDGRFVLTVNMLCGWLFVLPLMYFSAHVWHFPLPFVYFASRADQCFKWLLAFIRLRGNRWIHDVTRAKPASGT